MRGRTNLKHGKSPSSCVKNKISKVRKNEILGYKKVHLVGWKCYYDYEKQERVRQEENGGTALTREDITESDLERILCSAIPTDSSGNLIPARRSTLNTLFEGNRMSRQHISDVLLRKIEPERFDLITLNFLIFSLRVEEEPNPQKRYMRFIQSTNRILADCFMGPVYVTNPYECFVLMCMLSISPLETYNDVIEKSYQAE